jgi:hypothetical protein
MASRTFFAPVVAVLALTLAACTGTPPAATTPQPAATPAAQAPAARAAAPAWQDLNGARASSGEGELQRRGFELSTRRGLTAFWNHAPSQTCLRVVTSQGRYAVTQVPFQPNCPL